MSDSEEREEEERSKEKEKRGTYLRFPVYIGEYIGGLGGHNSIV
jgi:hypothetical protein